jgi:DNA-binding transcriptional ArsR family regulator
MTDQLPPDVRPRAFAGVELLLDVMYVAQSFVGLELESVLIYFCVAEATMRPLVLGPNPPGALINTPLPPEEARGSISRLLIADRTGLPRETVRRKTNALIEAGLLYEDKQGGVRTLRNLMSPEVQKAADDVFAAVQRYDARLRQLGRPGVRED